jgi:prepilin-type N-terminal cleavage/methylation domain-containing protein
MKISKALLRKESKPGGFTIVEIIIVLSIASLILAIVFLAVPQARISYRDSYRKEYARNVVAATIEFYKNNRRLPHCKGGEACDQSKTAYDAGRFIMNYMPKGVDPKAGNSYPDNPTHHVSKATSGGICEGEATDDLSTIYCWDDRGPTPNFIAHDFEPRIGQVVIAAVHVCDPGNVDNGEVNGTLIDQPSAGNSEVVLSVVIGTEHGGHYCISTDSYNLGG